jgi:EAL domain-containing protein (putative c-di-GMP-specific phosphodiesterase class I)
MALRRAVKGDEMELHFQPRIALSDGQPLGVEALVRWRHPERGLVLPAEFIPVAEQCGLIGALGKWVLETACRQGAAWQAQGLGAIPISVNISARQLDGFDLAGDISALTARYGISPALLEVELTESVVMADPEQVIELFTRLREMGTRVSIDDFGTGYSSLAYLRRLPIDVLKIDRSFVDGVDNNDEDARIIETILALSRNLALTSVAEGVETLQQADRLRNLGCDAAQGFIYARPMPAQALEEWWRANAKGG